MNTLIVPSSFDASNVNPPAVGLSAGEAAGPTPADRLRKADRDFWQYHQNLDNGTMDRCCAEYERLCEGLRRGFVPRGIGRPHDSHLFARLMEVVRQLPADEASEILEAMRV